MKDKNLEIKNSSIDKANNIKSKNKSKKQRTRKNNKKKVAQDNYVPPYSDVILNISVDNLMINDSIKESLKKANLNTVRDILKKRMTEMYRVQNIGKKQCFEILKALNPYNATFREEITYNKDDNSESKNIGVKNNVNTQKQKNIPNNKIQSSNDVENKHNKKSKKAKKDNFQLKTLHDGMVQSPFVQIPQEKQKYLRFSKGDLFGLKTLDKKDLIPPVYNDIYYFSEDLACVELDGKYGYINLENEFVIKNTFDLASSFSEGLAVVAELKNEESGEYICGYIDKTGKVVIPLQYDIATSFKDDKAFVLKDGRWGYINKLGEEVWL